jgi:hypothetical protein
VLSRFDGAGWARRGLHVHVHACVRVPWTMYMYMYKCMNGKTNNCLLHPSPGAKNVQHTNSNKHVNYRLKIMKQYLMCLQKPKQYSRFRTIAFQNLCQASGPIGCRI